MKALILGVVLLCQVALAGEESCQALKQKMENADPAIAQAYSEAYTDCLKAVYKNERCDKRFKKHLWLYGPNKAAIRNLSCD